MSKKFLPFNGRITQRKNGLIDITSPDIDLAGFRITLKSGTDSHEIACEALEIHGLRKSNKYEFYADELDAGPDGGLVLGLDEYGRPLCTELPNPGGIVWIVGGEVIAGTVLETFRLRLGSLKSKDLHAYGTRAAAIRNVGHHDSIEDLTADIVAPSCTNPTWTVLPVFRTTGDEAILINQKRGEFKAAKVLPLITSPRDFGIQTNDLVIVTSGYSRVANEEVPKLEDWLREVPLGTAFAKRPGEETYSRFRPC